ncbi:hypothetical protein JCM3770_003152 [Rhodotorula araucariae]
MERRGPNVDGCSVATAPDACETPLVLINPTTESGRHSAMSQPRAAMAPSHDHPLSPPLDAPTSPVLPDLRGDLLQPRSDSATPLFPASPPDHSPTDELTRRGSAATLLVRSNSSHGAEAGIGLGLPASTSTSRSRPSTVASAGARSRAASTPPRPPSAPLPRHLTLPAAPHALPPTSLPSLPLAHLAALAQALSAQLEEAQASLREGRAELHALERLAAEKGASAGEVERAKVRARIELREKEGRDGSLSKARGRGKRKNNEWSIELPVSDEAGEDAPAQVEVDLDLEDLTEAISSNAFDLGLSSPPPSDMNDSASVRSHAVSLPIPSSSSPDDRSDTASISSLPAASSLVPSSSGPAPAVALPSTAKPARARHASLSARFVGYIAGAPAASSGTSSAPALPSAPPASLSSPALTASDSPKRRARRSGSVRSVSSVASGGRGGYGEWLGWKGWGRGTGSLKEGPEGASPGGEAGGDEPRAEDGASEELHERDFRDQVANAGRRRGLSNASSSAPTDHLPPSPSSSRRTSTTRSTTLPTSTPPSPPSTLALEPTTPGASKALSPERRRSSASSPSLHPPDSPTFTRARSPGPPSSLFPASSQGTAAAVLSTPLITSTISAPSMASPSRLGGTSVPTSPTRSLSSRSLPLSTQADEGSLPATVADDEGEATIKARSTASGGAARPTFVAGVPLYSAAPDAGSIATASSEPGYIAAARGTFSRALGLGPGALPAKSGSSSGASSPPTSSPAPEANPITLPRLPSLSLSRYSPFAQPALSTPATHVSLSASAPSLPLVSGTSASAHPSPLIPLTATLASSGAGGSPQTMELDTISDEAAPPSLALLKPSFQSAAAAAGAEDDDGEGPMIDRYGFIYDVRAGMELLIESRRRKDGAAVAAGTGGRAKGRGRKKRLSKEPVIVQPEPDAHAIDALLTPPTELEAHPQLDALREAIGLTPTHETDNAFSPPTTPALAPSRPATLIRDPSSSTTASTLSGAPSGASASSGPQSMRALLAQLRSMTDAVDKTQQDAWDAFIRRRQAKLSKLKAQHLADVTNDETGAAAVARERSKSVWLAAVASDDGPRMASGGEEGWASENLVGVAQMGTEKKGKKEDWTEFKALVRKGIPIVYRPKIWGECSSANEAREPGLYQELLAQPTTTGEAQCLKQIDMDCHRTFPTNVFFAGNGPGVAKLRNVLIAYSRRNPKIGYCQGMNNLVATLLLTHPAEEDAFWVLVCIIENILPSDYYTSQLLVSRADQQVLQDLVARILPKLAAHLEEQGVELSAITFSWFLSLFTDSLPIQTLLRVWDLFFIHGTIFLFRIALAILKLHEGDLLECDSTASLYALLGQLPAGLWNADRLLKVACEDLASSVKDREVSVLRNRHVEALQEEMGLGRGVVDSPA